jgi:hypothetical protein
MIKRYMRRGAGVLAAAALFVSIGLAAPAAVSPSTMTPRRVAGSLAVVVALTGAVTGGRAMARAARGAAVAALVLAPIGLIAGGLVVATAKGGLGTGNGLAGGVVAMMVGLIGMTLGAMALARSRRTG